MDSLAITQFNSGWEYGFTACLPFFGACLGVALSVYVIKKVFKV